MPPAYTYTNPNTGVTSVVSAFPQAIDEVINLPSGIYNFYGGTYNVVGADLLVPSSTSFFGESPTATRFQFSGEFGIRTQGSSVYTTGTVTAASGINITGSGTLWLTNVAIGQSLFLGTKWYLIAAVTSDTTLVLAESYADNLVFPVSYRIATITTDIRFDSLGASLSGSTGIAIANTRRVILNNLQANLNNIGLSFENCSEVASSFVDSFANIQDGIEVVNMGLFDWRSTNADGNGASGFNFINVKTFNLTPCDASANGVNGFTMEQGVGGNISITATGNAQNGIDCSNDCSVNVFSGNTIAGNGGDGIKLSDSANTKITTLAINDNGGYGVNVSDVGSEDTLIFGNSFDGNISGPVQDLGTDTLIRSNIGVADAP